MENNPSNQFQNQQLGPISRVKKSNLLLIALGIISLVSTTTAAYLYIQSKQNMQFKSPTQEKQASEEATVKLILDPKKPFVTSTAIYQAVLGKIESFDSEHGTITISKDGEKFSLKLPIGKAITYVLKPYAQVTDMNKFKIGDEVSIGGEYGTSGNFEVTQFKIINQRPPSR